MNLCPNCCNADLENNICPKCGYKLGTEERSVSHLPYGVILQNRYFIGRVLGEGGFGITYLGFDKRLNMKIAVKEYYPSGFVSRENSDNTYTVHSFLGNKQEIFQKGLERFLKEAQRLSKFSNSVGVVNVRDVFEDNKTAYIVMEFIEGTTLSNVLKNVKTISEKSTLEMFIPIIKTLAQMHAEGIIHRDIAPDNIMVKPDGTAKLIDFGAAIDDTSTDDGKSTVALVKHGYAAEENYDNHHTRQGTWSDVYSISATMYKTLTGSIPPDAMDRLRGTPLPEITVPVSETVTNAIYQGMAVAAKDRIQTMTELLDRLEGKNEPAPVPAPAPEPVTEPVIKAEVPVPAPKTETVTETVQAPATTKKAKSRKPFIIIGSIAAAIVVIVGVALVLSGGLDEIESVDSHRLSRETLTGETVTTSGKTATAATTTKQQTTTTTPQTNTTATPTQKQYDLPPAKTYTYKKPTLSGDKLKLFEKVEYRDDGRIVAASHLYNDTDYAGYYIDYNPAAETLRVGYNLDDKGIYTGKGREIQIDLTSGRTSHRELLDGYLTGEEFSVSEYGVQWGTIKNRVQENGVFYYYSLSDDSVSVSEWKDGEELYSIKPVKETFSSSSGNYWWLDPSETLRFAHRNDYSLFSKWSLDSSSFMNYFASCKYDNYYYQGQVVDDLFTGLAIVIYDDGKMYIGGMLNNASDGYGLYIESDGKAYFVKGKDAEKIEEIKGLKIDISKIQRGY